MADVANDSAVYLDNNGRGYSLDFSKGYNPQARPDTSVGAYLQSRGLGYSWWNRNYETAGYDDWKANIDAGYNDYLDVYNNRWNGIENTFDQYQELGYNPFYMDKVGPSGPASSSGNTAPFNSPRTDYISRVGQTFGQLAGMMSVYNNLRQQQLQLDISDEELQRARTENEYLPEYLQFRNFLAGNRGDLTKTQSNIAGLKYDYQALWNDVQHWAFGRPAGYMPLSRGLTDVDYSGSLGAIPWLRGSNAYGKEKVLAGIVDKYSKQWAEWEDFSKSLSNRWDKAEMENFEKLLENWNKEVTNEGLNEDFLNKELNYKVKSFAVDRGFDYLSKILGLAGQATGLKTSAFMRQLSRRRQNFFEDTSRLGNFGIMPGNDYFNNNW